MTALDTCRPQLLSADLDRLVGQTRRQIRRVHRLCDRVDQRLAARGPAKDAEDGWRP
jgi:hypothetical protein